MTSCLGTSFTMGILALFLRAYALVRWHAVPVSVVDWVCMLALVMWRAALTPLVGMVVAGEVACQ
jgi:hypothetical protein